MRPLSPLELMVAPLTRGPGQDTSAIFRARLDHLARGRPPRMAVRWPRATGLTSYLSGCLSFAGQRCWLKTSPALRKFFTRLAWPRWSSRIERSVCPAFRRLSSGGPRLEAARVARPCWCTVATVYPLGNCDSPRPETSLDYLTRLGTVSHRSSPRSSCFASLTAREHRQRSW